MDHYLTHKLIEYKEVKPETSTYVSEHVKHLVFPTAALVMLSADDRL